MFLLKKEKESFLIYIHYLMKLLLYNLQWCQLKNRKDSLIQLVNNMMEYQGDQIMRDVNAPIPDDMRTISDQDTQK